MDRLTQEQKLWSLQCALYWFCRIFYVEENQNELVCFSAI